MTSKTAAFLCAICLLVSGGCSTILNFGDSDVERLKTAAPSGTPFQREQFRDYSYLAHSFGAAPSGELETLADNFAIKALIAAGGEDASPEDPQNAAERQANARLQHVLESQRSQHPADAATAQAEYDCWIMNARVSGQERSARQCRVSFDAALSGLEAQSP